MAFLSLRFSLSFPCPCSSTSWPPGRSPAPPAQIAEWWPHPGRGSGRRPPRQKQCRAEIHINELANKQNYVRATKKCWILSKVSIATHCVLGGLHRLHSIKCLEVDLDSQEVLLDLGLEPDVVYGVEDLLPAPAQLQGKRSLESHTNCALVCVRGDESISFHTQNLFDGQTEVAVSVAKPSCLPKKDKFEINDCLNWKTWWYLIPAGTVTGWTAVNINSILNSLDAVLILCGACITLHINKIWGTLWYYTSWRIPNSHGLTPSTKGNLDTFMSDMSSIASKQSHFCMILCCLQNLLQVC